MNSAKLHFDIVPSNPSCALGIEVWIDEMCILNQDQLINPCAVHHYFDDELEQTYVVKIVLKNKTAQHTQVNEKLEIVSDSVIEVNNFKLDDIDIDQMIREQAVYSHSFNSTSEYSDHKFYNTLGCNGVVKFEISTPAYLWLLEKM